MDPVGVGVAAAVLVIGVAIGRWRLRNTGRVKPEPPERIDPALLAGLGVDPESRVTLLQFSSEFCAPCRAVRRVSAEVAAEVGGVRHLEVDAEQHLDAVRALGIWRTPTLLIVNGDGRVLRRATGVPGKPELISAVSGADPAGGKAGR